MALPERDPPARRMALVRWSEEASIWKLEMDVRVIDGQHLRGRLAAMGRERPGHWRILDFIGTKTAVHKEVARMKPPSADAPGIDNQLKLF